MGIYGQVVTEARIARPCARAQQPCRSSLYVPVCLPLSLPLPVYGVKEEVCAFSFVFNPESRERLRLTAAHVQRRTEGEALKTAFFLQSNIWSLLLLLWGMHIRRFVESLLCQGPVIFGCPDMPLGVF